MFYIIKNIDIREKKMKIAAPVFKSRFFPRTIKGQMLVMVFIVIIIQIIISGGIFSSLVADFLKYQIGDKALRLSQTISNMPAVIETLKKGDDDGYLLKIIENIRLDTGAEYIVVADKTGTRLTHPVSNKIGKKFVGGDTGPALKDGVSYVSEAVGTLGPSIRGISPVYSDGEIIGFVAVGYLEAKIRATIEKYQRKPFIYVMMMIITGLGMAMLVANYQKKVTLGLEPAEIASLYLERGAIFEAIRAGIIAVNDIRGIRLINKTAKEYLGITGDVINKDISGFFPHEEIDETLKSGNYLASAEMNINNIKMVVNIVPIRHDGSIRGAVVTFRRKDEMHLLLQELSKVREYSEMLRVQSHEYSNKLHTIAGLIQIEAYQEACDMILSESKQYHELIELMKEAVPHPLISAVIIGKHNRAKELKIDFSIDSTSRLIDVPESVDHEKLVTIIGNLLDNAFDAVKDTENKKVCLHLDDTDEKLVLLVRDSGKGIDMDKAESIFEKGVTTKTEGRGVGLYLVSLAVKSLKGTIGFSGDKNGGTVFKVVIPKGVKDEKD